MGAIEKLEGYWERKASEFVKDLQKEKSCDGTGMITAFALYEGEFVSHRSINRRLRIKG